MLLAQAQSSVLSPTAIGLAVVAASVVTGSLGTVLTLFITRREVEQRATEFERRLDQLEQEAETGREQLQAVRRDIHESELRLAAAGEKRAADIHSRFNLLIEGLSELRGEVHASARSNSPR